jgi:predicted permease
MFAVARFRALLKLLFRRDTVEMELDAEVRAFYETMVDRYVERGHTVQEARCLARLKFSPPEQVKEEVRDARTGAALSSLLRDIRYALRTLRKNPAFALVTILTLALGIAANSTIFSMVSRFVLQPPPVGDPGSLMALHTTHDGDRCCNNFTYPLFVDVREQAKSFSGVASYYELVPASVGGKGEPERVWGQATTSNFFEVIQLGMTLGRGFTKDEERVPVIVLGHRLWQHRLGGDPSIVGKTITLSGRPFTVVGVAPLAFHGVDQILDTQFWVPLGNLDQLVPNTSNYASRDYHWLAAVGRLRPGVTRQQAAAELLVLAGRLAQVHHEEKGGGFRFEPAGSLPPRDSASVMMFLGALALVALLVLGIACANVANMFLAQASGRQREMSVRLALGATRSHLLHQMLTESVLLGLGGGLLGVLLSLWATQALTAFRLPAPVPLDLTVNVDWRVLLYTFLLSVGAGVLLGLAPAWAVARPIIANGIKGEDMFSRAGRKWSLRNMLVVAQISMSLVLLCSTGLFLRSLGNASQIDIGFRSTGILMMSLDPRLNGYSPERTTTFFNLLRDRVAAIPGVISASYTDAVPLSGGHRSDGFEAVGQAASSRSSVNTELYMAGPDYFETIGTPRVAGRDLSNESPAGPKVAVVNEVFAQQLFNNENPIGQHVTSGGITYEIVGVVKNIKSRFLGEEHLPVLYRSLAQDIARDPSFTGYTVLVRFNNDSAGVASAVRREIHGLDPSLAIFDAGTMEEHLRDALFLPRLAGTIFGIFGLLGLSLASVGLYGVMNYWVSRRTREIGIRLALGAQTNRVQRLIIGQGMLLTAIAIVPGLAAAWVVARLFTSVLYGVQPHDLAIFTTVPVFLAAVALLACWIPSRRAASAEPLIALRHE